ncbi:MAG: ABC transporter ATP-binding protein [Eubacteriales bacterium]|nr:ABC transporter ATP-binding protein [Eubacteriales bacterium]
MMENDQIRRTVLRFEDVSFRYAGAETESIRRIDLDVKEGEFLVLTGGSGCGKTTLTRLINGLGEQFYDGTLKGRVTLLGRSISEYPLYEIGKKVGSVFQDPKSQFFASVTEDEIAFGCENYGVPYEELDGRVSNAIRRINGAMLRGKEIYPMSSGEKQKIAVASVNAVDPEIYVFDEPSANLDMASVEALKNLMGELKAEGHTIVVAEHRLYYLTELADRFLYMENGTQKEEWTPGELLSMTEAKRRELGIRAADLRRIEPEIFSPAEKKVTLEGKELAFSYRRHPVFQGLSFQACAGDRIAVVGQNGVGKTTLSKILYGIQKEKSGRILYYGKEIPRGKRKNFAYFVMQNTDCQLFGDSVEGELLLNGKGSTGAQREELLKLYGLLAYRDRHPATLSGGQKQRLTLAVSDWIDTPVLILDEPTSGLDFKNMVNISEHLKSLAQKGKTILMITHDYEFAAMTCNRVLHFMDEDHAEAFPLQGNLSRLYSCLMGR